MRKVGLVISVLMGTVIVDGTPALAQQDCTFTREVSLPPDGVLRCRNVLVPRVARVTFRRNAENTPVTILASGDVTIAGIIDVNGGPGGPGGSGTFLGSNAGRGGAGGFDGGDGSNALVQPSAGGPGLGPGGGSGSPGDRHGRGPDLSFRDSRAAKASPATPRTARPPSYRSSAAPAGAGLSADRPGAVAAVAAEPC